MKATEARCDKLEAALERMEVRDVKGGVDGGEHLTRCRKQAAAGDCPISHKCPQGECALGVEQKWRPRGITHGYLTPIAWAQMKRDAALPSIFRSAGKNIMD